MALNVETGTGAANSESYASVADADAYLVARGDTAWVDLDTDVREAALRRATDYLEQVYGQRWKGTRKTSSQALSWPRMDVFLDGYSDGGAVAATVVPGAVRSACIELALRASTATLSPDLEARQPASETVGPISLSYDNYGRQSAEYPVVERLLSPLLAYTGAMARLVR